MEELTEVITAAEFHPSNCNVFAYSSSKGSIKLNDMRSSALCDTSSKSIFYWHLGIWPWRLTDHFCNRCSSLWSRGRSTEQILLFGNYFVYFGSTIQSRRSVSAFSWLFDPQDLGFEYGITACQGHWYSWPSEAEIVWSVWEWLHLWQVWVYL